MNWSSKKQVPHPRCARVRNDMDGGLLGSEGSRERFRELRREIPHPAEVRRVSG
jgi:hypothetical protein